MSDSNRRVLVTGAAGFIGFHTCRRLLERGDQVVGVDNLCATYDPNLKLARLGLLKDTPGFEFARLELADPLAAELLTAAGPFQAVVHLAAHAGVRKSMEAPRAYVESNVTGALAVLETCRRWGSTRLVMASTSSVYGERDASKPFSESDSANRPLSFYAATKSAGEQMAFCYAHNYGIETYVARFFTVYGPWGRPDMAVYKFTERMEQGRPIELYNRGDMRRDFTYIDDLVNGLVAMTDHQPATNDVEPFRVYNLGSGRMEELMELVNALEEALGKRADRVYSPMQPGDTPSTFADISAAARDLGYAPRVGLREGIQRFVQWYRGRTAAAPTGMAA